MWRMTIMKKIMAFTMILLIGFATLVYAGGDKNRGDTGSGSTGSSGGGATTQTRGN
jgi:hypothetical protein